MLENLKNYQIANPQFIVGGEGGSLGDGYGPIQDNSTKD